MRGSNRLKCSKTKLPNLNPSKKKSAPPKTQKPNHKEPSTTMHVDTLKKWNIAITTQMRSAQCDAAIRLFKYMPRRSTVSYNAMISGYLLNDNLDLARDLFDKMPQRDLFSWNVMITGYVRNKNLGAARELFDKMPERDVVSWNAMLSGYAQNGYVDDAREVFERMPNKNVVSWNGLLAAYVQSGRIEEARRLFELRADWELISWNRLIYGYVKRKRLVDARRLFDRMPAKDNVSWNTMITGYAQNGELQEAQRLFGGSPIRDVFAWTAMVSGYVQNGMLDEAKRIFDEMPEKNPVSWNAMIAGYVQCKRIDIARELFEAMPCRDAGSWNTMITGYAQNGNIIQARNLFDRMPQRDSISWAAIIAGYAQSGHSEEALDLFVEMTREGESPNAFSFSCTLSTCASIGLLELGKQLHGRLIKAGFENRCYVGNALLTMYCKCGNINEAYGVFEGVAEKDLVLWNTMITGFVRHGFGSEALMVFESMKTTSIKPNDVTMVGVLSACSRTGLVERGIEYFYAMSRDYSITTNEKHYACMIDLLGRAGRLDEAQNLMRNMPFAPDPATWGAVFEASRNHGYTELRKKAEMIFKMDFANSGMYTPLSNLYAASDRWGDVGEMRLKVRNEGVRKVPEHSWVEVQNQIHTFSIGDSSHPHKDRIYAYLAELDLQMKQERCVSSTKLVSDDVE